METYLNLLYIATITVLVSDNTDFFYTIENQIAKALNAKAVHIKLLECSLCQTFWLSLIYLIATNNVSIFNVMIVLLIATSTPLINNLFQLIQYIVGTLINKIYSIF